MSWRKHFGQKGLRARSFEARKAGKSRKEHTENEEKARRNSEKPGGAVTWDGSAVRWSRAWISSPLMGLGSLVGLIKV